MRADAELAAASASGDREAFRRMLKPARTHRGTQATGRPAGPWRVDTTTSTRCLRSMAECSERQMAACDRLRAVASGGVECT